MNDKNLYTALLIGSTIFSGMLLLFHYESFQSAILVVTVGIAIAILGNIRYK